MKNKEESAEPRSEYHFLLARRVSMHSRECVLGMDTFLQWFPSTGLFVSWRSQWFRLPVPQETLHPHPGGGPGLGEGAGPPFWGPDYFQVLPAEAASESPPPHSPSVFISRTWEGSSFMMQFGS